MSIDYRAYIKSAAWLKLYHEALDIPGANRVQ